MKTTNLLALIIFLLLPLNSQAQDEPFTGKNGQVILPEKGNVGLGVNLIPFFYWLGNAANQTTTNTHAANDKFFQIFGNSVVLGKYMLSNQSALRLAWGLNFGHSDEDKYVQNDASNNPSDKVIDARSLDWSSASLAVGLEMRRGKKRVQGFWGGDIRITYNQTDDYRYYYGNGYSATNLVPTAYNWGNNLNTNKRRTVDTGFNKLGVGVRAFVGVEYFVAPKLSIGVEFGWGLMFFHTLAATVTEEYYEVATQNIIAEDTFVGSTNTFSARVDNFDGAIFMLLYF